MFPQFTAKPARRVAAVVGAILLGATASTAHASMLGEFPVKIDGGRTDFGAGDHRFGAPSQSGKVSFTVGGGSGFQIEARVTGVLYFDEVFSSCTSMDILFLDREDRVLDQRDRGVCGQSENANAPDNQRQINESFTHPDLEKVKISISGRDGMIEPVFRASQGQAFTTKINAGTADFGRGDHLGGGPSRTGDVVFERRFDGIKAAVRGTLFYDSLFTSGCAKVIVDYLALNGSVIGSLSDVATVCGSGGNANDADNRRAVNVSARSARIAKVRITVGSVVGGELRNATARTFALTG